MIEELINGFNSEAFCKFLRSKFASFSELHVKIATKNDFQLDGAAQLGIVKTLAGPNGSNLPLIVVAAKLADGEKLKERSSRLQQFKFAKQVLDHAMANPAPGVEGVITQGLFVFHDDAGNFRLSLVFGKAEGAKLIWSTAKRLSFHVEAEAGNKTFRDRMALPWGSFDKLKEAFSVEKLTKEFYSRLFSWYQLALASDEVVFPNDVVKDKEAGEVKSEQIIRLITRLMFVWFLKQKHLVPDDLFAPEKLACVLTQFDPDRGENYYRVILQNLFFATLNSEIKEREFVVEGSRKENEEHFGVKVLYRYASEFPMPEKEAIKLFEKIPFLNGGLFECLDRDNHYYDGFSRRKSKQARIPNRLFFNEKDGLIPLLRLYNFTVEENSPGDEEVALDPELLGKVFENLLGAYNPETKVAARNATGSFYTPREIVNYMVDESLIAHLIQKVVQTFLSAEGRQPEAPAIPCLTHSPVSISQRRLPHWQVKQAVYWVTFRLGDSIPQEKLRQWKTERDAWKTTHHPEPWTDEMWADYDRQFTSRMDAWLDAGMGSRILAQEDVREAVKECLLKFDGERLLVHAAVIMPTHVHCLLQPIPYRDESCLPVGSSSEKTEISLSEILKGIKGASARAANKIIGQTGTFWMDESYDHIVRNEKQYRLFKEYIQANPVKAGLKPNEYWLRVKRDEAGEEQQTGMSATPYDALSIECEIRKLFTDGERPADRKLCEKMDAALVTAKILDPACGSGAFPMGILLRMVELLRILRRIPEDDSVYDLKLELIENCIYGGDIQCIAVQISKLRFFISLVCEQKPTANAEDNYGIHTLPNLETKFVAADSLIGLPKSGSELPMQNVETMKKELWAVRHRHFLARSHPEKKELRKEDKALREKLAKALEHGGGFDTTSAKLMSAWDPYDQNTSAVFSDPEWMFNVKDGFDVVIGNPPYIQLQANQGMLADLYEGIGYKTFGRTADIYCLFYERGFNILRPCGHLCYITSNQWMRTAYGKKIREFFCRQTRPIKLLDMGEGVFDATTNTNILLIEKDAPKETLQAVSVIDRYSLDSKSLLPWITLTPTSDAWIVSGASAQLIMAKMYAVGTLLKEWDIQINYGVKTGFNAGFIIDGAVRSRLLEKDSKNAEIIKPLLEGQNIKRYRVVPDDLWLINTHAGYQGVPAIDVRRYPSLITHLDEIENKRASGELGDKAKKAKGLFRRDDQGRTPYNLRNCAYLPEFEKEKITWGNLCQSAQFALVEAGVYINAPAPFITPANRYLLAVLNSSLGDYFIRCSGVIRSGGYFEYKPMFVEQLPVPVLTEAEQQPFARLVDKIISLKKVDPFANTENLEDEIDELVYNLYGLTPEEREIVKASVSRGGNHEGEADAVETEAIVNPEPKKKPAKPSSPMATPSQRKRKAALPASLPGWD